MPDAVVVGAGPAGLVAAIAAAGHGRHVVLCEQLDRPGAKLLASGGGRCNLANTASTMDFIARFGRQGRFMLPALEAMGPGDLRAMLARLGVPTEAPDGFHVYPASQRSADVLNALLGECRRLGAQVHLRTQVTALHIEGGAVVGVGTSRGPLEARQVVLAAGGRGYPTLGGTGGGYALARQAGHEIVQPVPALAALSLREGWPRRCSGVSLLAARLWIDLPRHRAESAAGQILFTHTGISGPAALDLSGAVARLLTARPAVPLRLDLLGDSRPADWLARFDDWQTRHGASHVHNLLGRHLPHRLAEAVCSAAGNVGDLPAARLGRAAREALAGLLTAAPLTATGTAGFEAAMVTRGGVALRQVQPATLASRLLAGLYFAGEVLDLDGPTGGYNLQWAFASGHLAGLCRRGPTGAGPA